MNDILQKGYREVKSGSESGGKNDRDRGGLGAGLHRSILDAFQMRCETRKGRKKEKHQDERVPHSMLNSFSSI